MVFSKSRPTTAKMSQQQQQQQQLQKQQCTKCNYFDSGPCERCVECGSLVPADRRCLAKCSTRGQQCGREFVVDGITDDSAPWMTHLCMQHQNKLLTLLTERRQQQQQPAPSPEDDVDFLTAALVIPESADMSVDGVRQSIQEFLDYHADLIAAVQQQREEHQRNLQKMWQQQQLEEDPDVEDRLVQLQTEICRRAEVGNWSSVQMKLFFQHLRCRLEQLPEDQQRLVGDSERSLRTVARISRQRFNSPLQALEELQRRTSRQCRRRLN